MYSERHGKDKGTVLVSVKETRWQYTRKQAEEFRMSNYERRDT